jgi:hypothetical protein
MKNLLILRIMKETLRRWEDAPQGDGGNVILENYTPVIPEICKTVILELFYRGSRIIFWFYKYFKING